MTSVTQCFDSHGSSGQTVKKLGFWDPKANMIKQDLEDAAALLEVDDLSCARRGAHAVGVIPVQCLVWTIDMRNVRHGRHAQPYLHVLRVS
jgi:hypothetical protein